MKGKICEFQQALSGHNDTYLNDFYLLQIPLLYISLSIFVIKKHLFRLGIPNVIPTFAVPNNQQTSSPRIV